MRVLTFLHSFEPGGVERIALRLVMQWRALGIDAPLFMGRRDGDMHADIGAQLSFITPPNLGLPTARWETLWMILTLPRVVRKSRPDVLFCAGNTYIVVAVALKLLLGPDCPPIVAKISNDLDRRDQPEWRRKLYGIWLRYQGRFIDHLVGMELPMAEEIRHHLNIPADRITIIPDPALSRSLIERLRSHPTSDRPQSTGRRFVAVGRLAPQKNMALMLRAFGRGAREGDTLTVFGDGPQRAKLETLARRLRLGADRVIFRGYVSEPAAVLPEFDILLLSSNFEGVPAVVLEALAAGLMVVATNCSRSMGTLLQHGRLGELVPVGDEHALTDAIRHVRPAAQDASLSLAQAERFTMEHASEAYLRVMAKLADKSVELEIVPAPAGGTPAPHRHWARVGDSLL